MSQTVRFKVSFPKAPKRPTVGPTLAKDAAGAGTAEQATKRATAATRRNVGRAARMLALAYKVEGMVESGELKDCAEGARRLGITRARMSQVMALLNLAPSIQEAILAGEHLTERLLRPALSEADWEAQAKLLRP